jgi:hypothetical protein
MQQNFISRGRLSRFISTHHYLGIFLMLTSEYPSTSRRTTTSKRYHINRCACKPQDDGGFTCARIYEDRGGVCTFNPSFLSYLLTFLFKRNRCLPGVPFEERCVLTCLTTAFCSRVPDVLGTLVRLSETDRPSGIQVEVLRAVQNMVILLDEQFLVHSVVHKAVLRLLRNCAGDDIQEQLDNQNRKVMGAAKDIVRSSPSEYEEDRESLPISVPPTSSDAGTQLSTCFAYYAVASGPFASFS